MVRSPWMTLTDKSYRNGESGDHNLALGIAMLSSSPGLPFAELINVSPSLTLTATSELLASPMQFTVTRTVLPSTSGVIFKSSIPPAATGSNHTVCQMPLQQVY